ncbi:fibronectin type III domain-containing protein [Enterococcus pseudoavium]|uniref:fibronectin type III domain-containing protein n=1 Tax=Enterococcus pseudoavium TaxID=44007 RepID=UPI0008371ED5|nr:fibronectin type III domain-containing protein [Enterococcus pseudoavium]
MKSKWGKKIKGIMSLVMLLGMTFSSLGGVAQVFAADQAVPANLTVEHNATQKWSEIKFDKVDKAENYYIYRAEEIDGEYQRVQTTKDTHTADPYMDAKVNGTLKADYLYYYKVSAVVEGQEQAATEPVANQDVLKEVGDSKEAERETTETSKTAQDSGAVASAYCAPTTKHKTSCDGKHSGSSCNDNNKHGQYCDKKHSSWRGCNENNWKHTDNCDKKHSGKNCNNNNCKHDENCDKNHNGGNCNDNKWQHKPDCDEKHNGHGCNDNWKHDEDCDKKHSDKNCNQNNYKEKWDAVKSVCITETQHHWLGLSWESKGADAEYKIYRSTSKCNDYHSSSFKEIATVKGKTSYNDLKLNHNTTYCYKVMVKRPKATPSYTIETVSSGNISKFTVCATTLNPCIKAKAVSERAIQVSWTNTKSDNAATRYATSYTLYRSTTNNINQATAIQVTGKQEGSEMTYQDNCLNPCTTYYYWVKANYGQWSSWVSLQWGSACATTLKKKEIGTDLKGCIQNQLSCGRPTRYYGAQIFLGTQKPTEYTKVRVYRKTGGCGYGAAYKTIDVRYAKCMNGSFGKGYYLDYSLSKVCLPKGTHYFAIQAVGSDCGKEITGPIKEIGCVTVKC